MRIFAIAIVAALAGCSATNQVDPSRAAGEAGAPPIDYRAQIVDSAKTFYFDPYSIKSAQITEPFLQNHITLGHFWAVCVRSNGKNRMGGYVGLTLDAYVFRNGRLIERSTHPQDYCASAAFGPFPELESIT